MSSILKRLKYRLGRKEGRDKTVRVNGKDKEMMNSSGWNLIIYHGKYFLTLANPQVTMICRGCNKYISSGVTVYRSRREMNQDYCKDCVLLKEHQYISEDIEQFQQEAVLNKVW